VADVLAAAAGRDELDHESRDRRRAAVRILREHGLEDVLGVPSGSVWDVHLGELPPVEDPRARAVRAAMDYAYEQQRSERERADRVRAVDQFRANLGERRRARGWDRPASTRSSVQRPVPAPV